MLLDQQVKEILMKNNDLRKFKNDPTVKSSSVRVMNLFVAYGLYSLNENGNIIGSVHRTLELLTNFELLHLIESIIFSNDKLLMDFFIVKSIQSIDYIGKCWYYPKELSSLIFELTGKRHNYKKIKIVLNRLVDKSICLKITNKKCQSMYRILFTYSGLEESN